MFGSRRNRFKQTNPGTRSHLSTSEDYFSGRDFEILLTKSEFRPGEMVTFEVNAKNGNAVRLNLSCALMQTAVHITRGGRFGANKTEIGSVRSHSTFCNMMWRDQVYIPPATPVSKELDPVEVQEGTTGGALQKVVEIRYSLILSTIVESVPLIRDEVKIKIVAWNFGPNAHSNARAMVQSVSVGGGVFDVPVVRVGAGRRASDWDTQSLAPPHYSMLSLYSPFSGSTETLPPNYEEAVGVRDTEQ